jgi:hypothetical protein
MNKNTCKKTPFKINEKAALKSPFRSLSSLKKTLKKYKQKKSIGFTATSSLRSMGLIPRSNNCYLIGDKYKKLIKN